MKSNGKQIEFTSRGTICRGLLFPPERDDLVDKGKSPCVILAHGFAGTIDAGLEPYACRFAEKGIHALVFDYRHFGISDGQPRQLLSIKKQLDDWQAAITFARTLENVDASRIALWGSSFSGGHVVLVAIRDGNISAVTSQCPMMDGRAALMNVIGYGGILYSLRLVWKGLLDLIRSAIFKKPLMLPVIGPPGSIAAMTTPDAEPGYRTLTPPDWRNEVCARIVLGIGNYRPGLKTKRLPCPILIQICEQDSVAPVKAAKAAALRAKEKAVIKRYPIGHFDIYTGNNFERSVNDQVEFLTRFLSTD